MKKCFIALLALVMMFALAAPVFADDYNTSGNVEQDVTAGYTPAKDNNAGTVYRVTIEWQANAGDPALSYTGKQSTYTWDTEGLQYKEKVDTAAGWTGETGYTVTVTNYSNAAINAAVDATNNYSLDLVKPNSEAAALKSAATDSNGDEILFTETGKVGTKQETTFTYTYKAKDGADAPADDSASTVSVGKITVTISGN